jgi:hypothetical protein
MGNTCGCADDYKSVGNRELEVEDKNLRLPTLEKFTGFDDFEARSDIKKKMIEKSLTAYLSNRSLNRNNQEVDNSLEPTHNSDDIL